jgi:tRNA pseudouridine38-40 synthase
VLAAAIGAVADHPIELVCGGRTDAGVHAGGQVVHFESPARRTLRAWVLGTNTRLPPDVSVAWALPVPDYFHARFSALVRTYEYFICNRPVRSALAAGRAAWVREPLDVGAMQAGALDLVGEHDFRAFRAVGCQSRSTIRRVDELVVERSGDFIALRITANAFLQHMVRNIAGQLIEIGQSGNVTRAREVLLTRDRRLAAPTAPAQGLTLASIDYPGAFGLPRPSALALPARSAMIAAAP